MNKLDLPPFYVGQKVVYITGYSMPKDSIHTVTAIARDECGCWNILINNIGPKSEFFGKSAYHCTCCRKTLSNNCLKGWWATTSFRAVKEQKMPLLTFAKIKEKEKEEILILN